MITFIYIVISFWFVCLLFHNLCFSFVFYFLFKLLILLRYMSSNLFHKIHLCYKDATNQKFTDNEGKDCDLSLITLTSSQINENHISVSLVNEHKLVDTIKA